MDLYKKNGSAKPYSLDAIYTNPQYENFMNFVLSSGLKTNQQKIGNETTKENKIPRNLLVKKVIIYFSDNCIRRFEFYDKKDVLIASVGHQGGQFNS